MEDVDVKGKAMQVGSDLSAKDTEEPRRRRQEDAPAKHTGEILRGRETRLAVPEACSASPRSVPAPKREWPWLPCHLLQKESWQK